MEYELLKQNIESCRARLERAAQRWGRPVRLCAVTKTVDVETINLSYAAGVRIIGENRVQEAREKFPALNPDFALHIIGQLQTNKVKYILEFAQMVQSLDRMALAQEIDRRAKEHGRAMPVLIQVNIARESQKSGVYEEDLEQLVRQCARLDGLSVKGLMAIMPLCDDPEQVRPYFRAMRAWYERLRQQAIAGVEMEYLSMGMSGDYVVAAEEGANMVRVGSAIFGHR